MTPKRKMVLAYVRTFSPDEFFPYGKFTLKELKNFIEHLSLEGEDESAEHFYEAQPYGYDGAIEIEQYQKRLETDMEYAARLKKNENQRMRKKTAAKKQEDKEYAEYLKLKEKFEKSLEEKL
jgi:hypothetical protein